MDSGSVAPTPPRPPTVRREKSAVRPGGFAAGSPSARRWIRSLSSALAVALAFIAGDLLAAYIPGFASWFGESTTGVRGLIGGASSRFTVGAIILAVFVVLYGLIIVVSSAQRRTWFMVPAVILALLSLGAGSLPKGHQRTIAHQLAALQADLRQSEATRQGLDSQIAGLRGQIAAKTKDVSTLTAEKDQMMQELATEAESLSKVRQQIISRDETIRVLSDRIKKSDETAQALRTESDQLKQDNVRLKQELDALRSKSNPK